MPFLGKVPSQLVDSDVDIDGGSIDGVSIGSVTANAGAFTNLTATGTLTLPDDGISGDDVNGGTISNFTSTGIDDNATSTALTVTDSGIAATLTTATQPNITSVGALTGFTSTGIDDNATSTAITIDSSGLVNLSGSIEATTAYRAYDSIGAAYRNVLRYDNGNVRLETGSAGTQAITAFAGGQERMRIDSNGKVGIGVDTTSYSNTLVVDQGGNYAGAHETAAILVRDSTGSINSGDYHGAISFSRGTGQAAISAVQTGNDSDSLGLAFWTHPSSTGANPASEKMRIDHTGRVGIGTDLPDSLVEVSGADESQIKVTGASGVEAVMRASASTVTFGSNTAHNLYLRTSNSARVTVESTGNVGVGIQTPDEKLVVNGKLGFAYNNSISAYTIGKSDDQYGINYHSGVTSNTTKIAHTFGSSANSNIMSMTYGGNVAIGASGITGALFKTDIKGSSTGNFQALRLFNSSDGASATTDLSLCLNRVGSEVLGVAGSIKAGKEQTWTTAPSTVDGYLSFSTVRDETPAERMRLDSAGNLLIGRNSKSSITSGGIDLYGTAATFGTSIENVAALQNGVQSIVALHYKNGIANIGCYKHANVSNPSGYVYFSDSGNIRYFLYQHNGTWRTSNTAAHIGTNSGTVVGTQTSDERIKTIESDFEYGLDTVMGLAPIAYSFNDDPDAVRKLGFGAQTTQSIVPEAVYDTGECFDGYDTDPEDPMSQVARSEDTFLKMEYVQLIPVMVKAIQEQQAIIDSQASAIADLTTRLEALEAN